MAKKGFSSSASRRLKKGSGNTAHKIRAATSGRFVKTPGRTPPKG